jgi:Ca2+-binding EF-hand superfamily protein
MTITSAGSSTSLAQLRQLQQSAFKTADADGDGQLSLTEFQSIGQNVQGSDGQKGPPPMRGGRGPGGHFSGDTLSSLLSTQSVDDLTGSLMKAGDADGDGKMTASELSSALAANAPEGAKGQGIEDKMASDIMSALDTDGDGSLSSSEISSAITTAAANQSSAQATRGAHGHHGGPPPAGGASGSGGVFESLDTNKDGTVSAEELAAANTSSDGASGTSAASDLIKTADQDGDGALSGDEFAAMLDQGKSTGTDTSSALASLMSGSSAAADLMQKLLAQLDKAMTTSSSSASASGSVSTGTNVTA